MEPDPFMGKGFAVNTNNMLDYFKTIGDTRMDEHFQIPGEDGWWCVTDFPTGTGRVVEVTNEVTGKTKELRLECPIITKEKKPNKPL